MSRRAAEAGLPKNTIVGAKLNEEEVKRLKKLAKTLGVSQSLLIRKALLLLLSRALYIEARAHMRLPELFSENRAASSFSEIIDQEIDKELIELFKDAIAEHEKKIDGVKIKPSVSSASKKAKASRKPDEGDVLPEVLPSLG